MGHTERALLVLSLLCASCSLSTRGEMAEGSGGASSGGSGGMSTGGAGGAGGSQAGAGGSIAGAGGSQAGAGGSQAGAGGTSDAATDAVSHDVVVGTEDCLNGVDDNGDGEIDCDDPQCTKDYECVPASPEGFSAPGTVLERAPADAPAPCSLEVASTYNGELSAPKAGCKCGCEAPTGGKCSTNYKAEMWANDTCNSANAWLPDASKACELLDQTVIPASVAATSVPAVETKGVCALSVALQPSVPGWGKAADVCVSSKAGKCAAGVCVPKLATKPCVVAAGDIACTGAYSKKHVYYESYADTRACTTGGCTCDPAAGETCEASIKLFSDTKCQTLIKEIALTSTCSPTGSSQTAWSEHVVVGEPTAGSCVGKGSGTVTGDVTGAVPHTVCCEP